VSRPGLVSSLGYEEPFRLPAKSPLTRPIEKEDQERDLEIFPISGYHNSIGMIIIFCRSREEPKNQTNPKAAEILEF